MRRAISFLHSPLTEQVPPRRLSTFFQQRRAACQSQVPGTGWASRANASAPVALDDCEVPSNFQLTDDCAGFGYAERGPAAVQFGNSMWRWDCVERRSRTQQRHSRAGSNIWVRASARACLLLGRSAAMQIDTDGLSARVDDLIEHLEGPAKQLCYACLKRRPQQVT